jgi:uridine kinase
MIVAISGGTGSGKTFLSKGVQAYISNKLNKNVFVMSMDNYYKNIHVDFFENYDHPTAFDIISLVNDINIFLAEGSCANKNYSFDTKLTRHYGFEKNIDILIVEGLYANYFKKLKKITDLKVHVNTDIEVSIRRRIERDEVDRGISKAENLKMINSFVLAMHKQFVSTQCNHADLVMENSSIESLVGVIENMIDG